MLTTEFEQKLRRKIQYPADMIDGTVTQSSVFSHLEQLPPRRLKNLSTSL